MDQIMKYYKGSFFFTLVGSFVAYALLGGTQAMMTALILGVLEVSLSFDNAVVNAKYLKTMDDIWKKRFLTWGMVIAVFGMRVIFPIIIVCVVTQMSPIAVLHMAMYEQDAYATALISAHVEIAAFGSAFLMMVFLSFFFDKEKEVHWIDALETKLIALRELEITEVLITLITLTLVAFNLPEAERFVFMASGIIGLITFELVEVLGVVLEGPEDENGETSGSGAVVVQQAVKGGIGTFIYLEVMDASFSFDGVIGAFALSHNIFLIAIGLGIGAMFVRSMTIQLVERGTLGSFRYLEHGAFYAIGALASFMLLGLFHEIPEVVTGLTGAGFIGIALISSIMYNKKNPKAAEE